MTEPKLSPNTKQDGCGIGTTAFRSPSPSLVGCLYGSQPRLWIFALLVFSLIALLDLTVQFQPAFYTSEIITRSCHVPNIFLPLQKLF